MTFPRLAALACLTALSMPALAASDDDLYVARNYLRCAAFYVFGSTGVTRPELRQQLQELANISLYSAEKLMDQDRPKVKEEFDTARAKFFAEIESDEVKADTRGFLNYLGNYCTGLRQSNPVP